MTESDYPQLAEDYRRVEQAIRFLEAGYRSQPSLEEIAGHVGLSEYHFQRLFTRWAGISPKRFVQALTLDYARRRLAESESILAVSLEAGLSGPGRLHDLFVTHEAVTPGEFKHKGEGLTIRYGFHPSPFGICLIGVTERGITALNFVDDDPNRALQEMIADWPAAALVHDPAAGAALAGRIFRAGGENSPQPLPVYLSGTNFQIKVWRALLAIPPGALVSYGEIAQAIGQPEANRAVGSAIGRNSISFLIPCHRVIRSTGVCSSYRWGAARKKAIQVWEAARYLPQSL